MGYFSELDLKNRESYQCRGSIGFDEQLVWRYEELLERYLLLSHSGAPMRGDDFFSKDDYLYAPAECFEAMPDVFCAMEAVRERLEECDIFLDFDGNVISSAETERDPNQISIFEVVFIPPLIRATAA